MHSIPLGAFQQVNVLEGSGARRKRIERRRKHADITFYVLDAALAKWRTRGKISMRHRLNRCERAPAGISVSQIGSNVRERRIRRSGSRQAVDTPAGSTRERVGDGRTGRARWTYHKCNPVSHRKQIPFAGHASSGQAPFCLKPRRDVLMRFLHVKR